MAHAVDYVIEVMKKISSTEPQMFQRDGSLYIVSEAGFGQVTYGLSVRPEKFQPWQKKEQKPEIVNSVDLKTKKGISEEEKKYLAPVCFGSDDMAFNLKGMAWTTGELAKLPDDGNIRMVRHGSHYHSHKYGYACDGIDVYLTHARKMKRDLFLKLVREKEESLVKRLSDLVGSDMDSHEVSERYRSLRIPICVIMTPRLMVSLPLKGRLDYHKWDPVAWTMGSGFQHADDKTGSILHPEKVDTYEESPYGLHMQTNSIGFEPNEIDKANELLLSPLEKELSAVRDSKELVAGFLDGLNSIHNKVCAKDIEWRKDLRKPKKKKRA